MSRSSGGAGSHAALNSPNLFWGAISPQQLRHSSSYQALPDPASVVVTDTCHYRFASLAARPTAAAAAHPCRRAGRACQIKSLRCPCTRSPHRFLRQTPELRDRTHHGILSTANLRDALGFSEPEAAKLLGCSSQVRGRPRAPQPIVAHLV
jgi:hypothetical protein